jgi:hypothetical protein
VAHICNLATWEPEIRRIVVLKVGKEHLNGLRVKRQMGEDEHYPNCRRKHKI